MLTNFEEHINNHFPFLKGKKILVAISGGIDSVALTHLFVKTGFDVSLAHCNFRLRRKESDADEQFVKELAEAFNIPFFSIGFDTTAYAEKQQLSIQMAARELRYEWFEKIRIENNIDYITTAHHLDDNLETFLINFTRGTGLNGLTGIPEFQGNIVRPLLPFSREEIEAYATKNKISWREDASNAKTAYQRNKIRHQLVPLLKEMNPNLLASFQNTTNYLKESQDIINDTIESFKKSVVIPIEAGIQKINIKKLKQFSNPKAYLFELLKEYGFTQWNDIVNLLQTQSGKQIFSKTHRLLKDRDHFILAPRTTKNNIVSFLINEGQKVLITEGFLIGLTEINSTNFKEKATNVILVDADKLQFPLELRKRKESDYFYPLGMTGKKKISKFFKDEKLSLIAKENSWLLCAENDVVWVVNQRLDDRFKVTSDTKKTIQIEYIKHE